MAKKLIKEELTKVTGLDLDREKGESNQDFITRIVAACDKAISEDDKMWDKLSEPAQDFMNANVKAITKKKAVTWFPDEEEPEEKKDKKDKKEEPVEKPDKEKEEDKKDKKEKEDKPAEIDLKKGMKVVVTTTKGTEIKGEVVKAGSEVIVVTDEDGDERTIKRSNIETIVEQEEKATGKKRETATKEKEKEEEEPKTIKAADAEEGETYTFEYKDKTITAECKKANDKVAVFIDDDGEKYTISAKDKIIVGEAKKAAGKGKEKEEPKKTEKKPEKKAEKKEKGEPKKSGNARVKELICDHPDWDADKLAKALEKEDIELKVNTIKLTMHEVMFVLDYLKGQGRLKKAE